MKLFEWLPESEETSHGRHEGHYLWMNFWHFHLGGDMDMMIGGTMFNTLHPGLSILETFLFRDIFSEYELSLWIVKFFFRKVRDSRRHLFMDDRIHGEDCAPRWPWKIHDSRTRPFGRKDD